MLACRPQTLRETPRGVRVRVGGRVTARGRGGDGRLLTGASRDLFPTPFEGVSVPTCGRTRGRRDQGLAKATRLAPGSSRAATAAQLSPGITQALWAAPRLGPAAPRGPGGGRGGSGFHSLVTRSRPLLLPGPHGNVTEHDALDSPRLKPRSRDTAQSGRPVEAQGAAAAAAFGWPLCPASALPLGASPGRQGRCPSQAGPRAHARCCTVRPPGKAAAGGRRAGPGGSVHSGRLAARGRGGPRGQAQARLPG